MTLVRRLRNDLRSPTSRTSCRPYGGCNESIQFETSRIPGPPTFRFKSIQFVGSLKEVKRILAGNDIPPSGQFSFEDLSAVFPRDPDRNVIELDTYTGNDPQTRITDGPNDYQMHP